MKSSKIYEIQQGAYKKQIELNSGKFDFDLGACQLNINFEKIWKK